MRKLKKYGVRIILNFSVIFTFLYERPLTCSYTEKLNNVALKLVSVLS